MRPKLDASTEFFDASGTMAAAERETDCDCFCGDRSFSMTFGPVPDRSREPTIETCEPVPAALGR